MLGNGLSSCKFSFPDFTTIIEAIVCTIKCTVPCNIYDLKNPTVAVKIQKGCFLARLRPPSLLAQAGSRPVGSLLSAC